MKVPLLDLKAQIAPLHADLLQAFERVLQSGQYILGREVESFEHSVAQLLGAKHAIGVSSGTDAILLALMALGIGPGDEVICPSFTFFATPGCVARLGAKPVFCDCDPVTFNIDIKDAARLITPRTKAIIPVHLFGQCADLDDIINLAQDHKIAVVEDAAQAIGATYRGRPAGTFGDFGTFSFFPSKNLGGFGESGMVITSSDALADKAFLLRSHGAQPKYYHKIVGGNFRIDPLQAALLSVKLPHLAEYSSRRAANAAHYSQKLADIPGLILPYALPHNVHIWNQYTLRVPGMRDALRAHLSSREIGTEIYYPVPMHLQECFAPQPLSLPVSEQLAKECLSLPIFPELSSAQLDYVAGSIADFFTSKGSGRSRHSIAALG